MRKLTHQEFLTRATAVHGATYRYLDSYVGTGIPMRMLCPVHGEFTQTPNAHISQKQGCPLCARTTQAIRQASDVSDVVAKFVATHGQKYDYAQVEYVNMHHKVTILCRTHGAFLQTPQSHIKGRGCPKCAVYTQQAYNLRRNAVVAANFEALARRKHGSTFDYTLTEYTHNQHEITLRCVVHNRVVTQTARDHLDGYNPCPSCNHMKSSGEAAVFAFLSNLTRAEARNRTIVKPRELDIYLPDRKIAVEYCGEFWHSHRDQASEKVDKRKHIDKYRQCKEHGIRLITLLESEWKEHNYAVRRLLRNAVGKSKGKLMARKCELRKVSNADARVFYDRYHPQGGAGNGEHYALFWKGKMVACMRFVLGANDRGAGAANRVWTLGRYATRITVAGAASRLFKEFVREFNPPVVKSFSDNRFFDGGMYEQLGFALEADVPEDYQVWSPKLGLRPKSHYQRRLIPKRLEEHGMDPTQFDPATDSRTEAEMTYLMGARRLYDCGKKRWVWTASEN